MEQDIYKPEELQPIVCSGGIKLNFGSNQPEAEEENDDGE